MGKAAEQRQNETVAAGVGSKTENAAVLLDELSAFRRSAERPCLCKQDRLVEPTPKVALKALGAETTGM